MSDELLKEIRSLKETLAFLQQRMSELERRAAHPTPPPVPPPTPPQVPVKTAQPVSREPAPPAGVVPPSPRPVTPATAVQHTPAESPLVKGEVRTGPAAEPCPSHQHMIRWRCATCGAPLCADCGATSFEGRVFCQKCVRTASASASAVAQPAKAAPQGGETFETKIGRYWLNRIGIGSLVLGVAFFILYSFQYLGPAAKIGIGFAVGGGLLGAGIWLERKAALSWYARGLLGGGWAVVYFTTYAMHHIPAVRILPSALVDLVLLFAVTTGAVWHSLTYRSQVITALAFLLGFITTSISHVTYFTLASSVLLVVSLVVVVVRMRWHGLLLYGVVGSYLTHLFWVERQIAVSPIVAIHTASVAAAQFWLHAGFLALYWVAYTIAILAFEERSPERRNALLTATLANSLLFITRLIQAMAPVYADAQYLVLLGVGAISAALSPVARGRGLPAVSTAQLLLGLTLMTLAIPERLTERWTSFLWLVEVASFVWVGLRYDRWAYRVFAFALGIVMGSRLLLMDFWHVMELPVLGRMIPWRTLIGCVAIGAFGVAAAGYRMSRYRASQRPIESPAFHVYAAAAAVVAWLLTALEGSREVLSLVWALEAGGMVLLGWWLRDRGLRMFGAVWFGTVCLVLLTDVLARVPWWQWPPTAGAIASLYAVGALYRLNPPGETFGIERVLRHVYAAAASFFLTALLWREVSSHWLPVAWALEGLGLAAVGWVLRDVVFRLSGLVVFGLLALLLGADFVWALGGTAQAARWNFSTTPWVIGTWYAMWWWYRRHGANVLSAWEHSLADCYSVAASLTLTALLWLEVQPHWLSVAWALEGMALVACGFVLRDKVVRVSGLSVFGLLVLRVLFVDLAGAETIYRILSFIVAGAILLSASFAYARFSTKASTRRESR